jgi:hypothetical protein
VERRGGHGGARHAAGKALNAMCLL